MHGEWTQIDRANLWIASIRGVRMCHFTRKRDDNCRWQRKIGARFFGQA